MFYFNKCLKVAFICTKNRHFVLKNCSLMDTLKIIIRNKNKLKDFHHKVKNTIKSEFLFNL